MQESLLSTSHSLTISSSFCKTDSLLDKHLTTTKIAESSVYNKSVLLTALNISLTHIKKKRGPSPCIKQAVCKVLNRFQCGKYLAAYVLKIHTCYWIILSVIYKGSPNPWSFANVMSKQPKCHTGASQTQLVKISF